LKKRKTNSTIGGILPGGILSGHPIGHLFNETKTSPDMRKATPPLTRAMKIKMNKSAELKQVAIGAKIEPCCEKN